MSESSKSLALKTIPIAQSALLKPEPCDDPRAAFQRFFEKTPTPYTCELKEADRQLQILMKGKQAKARCEKDAWKIWNEATGLRKHHVLASEPKLYTMCTISAHPEIWNTSRESYFEECPRIASRFGIPRDKTGKGDGKEEGRVVMQPFTFLSGRVVSVIRSYKFRFAETKRPNAIYIAILLVDIARLSSQLARYSPTPERSRSLRNAAKQSSSIRHPARRALLNPWHCYSLDAVHK